MVALLYRNSGGIATFNFSFLKKYDYGDQNYDCDGECMKHRSSAEQHTEKGLQYFSFQIRQDRKLGQHRFCLHGNAQPSKRKQSGTYNEPHLGIGNFTERAATVGKLQNSFQNNLSCCGKQPEEPGIQKGNNNTKQNHPAAYCTHSLERRPHGIRARSLKLNGIYGNVRNGRGQEGHQERTENMDPPERKHRCSCFEHSSNDSEEKGRSGIVAEG